jgi:uncharacterized membrane protein
MKLNFKRYFVSGLVTIIPLGITWWLLSLLFQQLVSLGLPLVRLLSQNIRSDVPDLARLLLKPWFDDLLAALLVVVAIYLLGWATNRVIGGQIINVMDRIIERLPLAKSIYGSIKKLIVVLQTKPEDVDRVVLINFPNNDMKTVGLVTRTLVDKHTGKQLAAVYVPTTPNPTNGYLEIVPIESLITTDWTIEEAMNFIISGGAIAPEDIPFESRSQDT